MPEGCAPRLPGCPSEGFVEPMLATGLDIGSGFRPPYTEMKLLKLATVMLGLAIFLVNTGDCVNLAFADAKASDCCLKEDCPLAPTSRMDSCCTTPASPS